MISYNPKKFIKEKMNIKEQATTLEQKYILTIMELFDFDGTLSKEKKAFYELEEKIIIQQMEETDALNKILYLVFILNGTQELEDKKYYYLLKLISEAGEKYIENSKNIIEKQNLFKDSISLIEKKLSTPIPKLKSNSNYIENKELLKELTPIISKEDLLYSIKKLPADVYVKYNTLELINYIYISACKNEEFKLRADGKSINEINNYFKKLINLTGRDTITNIVNDIFKAEISAIIGSTNMCEIIEGLENSDTLKDYSFITLHDNLMQEDKKGYIEFIKELNYLKKNTILSSGTLNDIISKISNKEQEKLIR